MREDQLAIKFFIVVTDKYLAAKAHTTWWKNLTEGKIIWICQSVAKWLFLNSFSLSFMVDIMSYYFCVQDCIKTIGMFFVSMTEKMSK